LSIFATQSFAEDASVDSASQFIAGWAAAFDKNDPKQLAQFYEPSEQVEVIFSAGVRFRGHDCCKSFSMCPRLTWFSNRRRAPS
jgi:hypothetical protein